jgi:DNA-binding GntR family transcriptional regulator
MTHHPVYKASKAMHELAVAERALAEASRPPHETLAQWAAIRLREMIAHSQLPAGQRIYEHDLAARMGISRTPVRQAIRQLEGEGLVSIRANRETIVTDFTPTDVREIYQFRAAIEGMAAALAARNANRGVSTSALLEILGRMEAALASDQPEAYLELDIAFHDAVVQACGNARLMEARKRVRDQTRRYLAFPLTFLSIDSLRSSLAQHMAIGEAIRDANAELAEKLMRVHIMSNGERIAEAMTRPVAL